MRNKLLTFLGIFLFIGNAFSQGNYPHKPVDLVVGFAPGGINDIAARIISKHLEGKLGKPVIVVNKAGASGVIGARSVVTAKPDGYTLLLGSVSNSVIAPMVSSPPAFDPATDLSPVALIGGSPNILVVNTSSHYKNIQDIINTARQDPGKMTFGSAGIGAANHLAGEFFQGNLKIKITHVPYKGDAQALLGLIGGETDFMFATIPAAINYVKSGKLRALGVTSDMRSTLAPDIKTFKEQDLDGFVMNVWVGIFAPSRTPEPILDVLSDNIYEITSTDLVKKELLSQGVEPDPRKRSEFGAVVLQDKLRWGKVIKSANISTQ